MIPRDYKGGDRRWPRVLFLIFLPFLFSFTDFESHALHIDTWMLKKNIDAFVSRRGPSAVVLYDADKEESLYLYNHKDGVERGFPPGSIVKPFAAALLHAGGKALESWTCRGKYYPPRSSISEKDFQLFHLPRDKKKRPYFRCSLRKGHGSCDLREALRVSCNSYFLRAAEKDRSLVEDTAALWGLDALSDRWHRGIKESSHLPVTSFRKQAAVIGEGGLLLLSPLEVARVYGQLLFSPPEFKKKVPASTCRFILKGLRDVVEEGTLKKLAADNRDIEIIGGKTGTATLYGQRYRTHGWNVVLFRYRKMSCVMVTFVARGSGSRQARELSEIVLRGLKLHRIN